MLNQKYKSSSTHFSQFSSNLQTFIQWCVVFVAVGFPLTSCIVLQFKQSGKTSTFNYTNRGLTISIDEKEKCMPDIGCFSAGAPFFDPISRPVSLLPQDRDEVATAFLLYTRKNPHFFQFLKAGDFTSVLESDFLLDTETKFIVPGWMDNLKVSNWMQDMKDAFLNYADCNVIIVDWSKSNRIPFALAVANTRVVGAELALLVNFLEDSFGVSPTSCHIIGHSLGTEIAGYAGERINNLGRITALDPAGPYFRNVSTKVRLDPSDALFVDAIHGHSSDTHLDKPSRMQPTGHIDFYPNGGESQPGCRSLIHSASILETLLSQGVFETARNLFVCDHYRVIEYFLATIPNHYGCQPVAVSCKSWEDFEEGKCSDCGVDGSQCVVMGFQTDIKKNLIKSHPPKKYFLYTAPKAPFCMQQYHVSVKLGNKALTPSTVGDITVTLIGSYGTIPVEINKRNGYISPGMVYKTIVTSNENIGVKSISFSWECATLKISDSIRINIAEANGCKLFLHSIIVTTFTASLQHPGSQIVLCGPDSPIPADFKIELGPESYCAINL